MASEKSASKFITYLYQYKKLRIMKMMKSLISVRLIRFSPGVNLATVFWPTGSKMGYDSCATVI